MVTPRAAFCQNRYGPARPDISPAAARFFRRETKIFSLPLDFFLRLLYVALSHYGNPARIA
jgi:hypothetical protein